MSFTSRRGRPPAGNNNFTIIEGGKQEAVQQVKPIKRHVSREPVDILHEKAMISDSEHWAALHFRWLYSIRFGAPGISALDLDKLSGRPTRQNDEKWQEEREREYAMAIEKLRHAGALKIVLNIAVFNHLPRYMKGGRINRNELAKYNFAEVVKLREGLELLAKHWQNDRPL